MNPASSSTINVRHNVPETRFEAEVSGQTSLLEYVVENDRMIFTHTYTPPAFRGRGIAEKLVRTGLDYAREKNRKVVPACSYVAAFIERHAEYQPLLAS